MSGNDHTVAHFFEGRNHYRFRLASTETSSLDDILEPFTMRSARTRIWFRYRDDRALLDLTAAAMRRTSTTSEQSHKADYTCR